MKEEKKNRKILKRLKNKYRLVILNDSSFEEKFSYRLSPLNIVTLLLTLAVFLMGTVAVIIIFTPLREYIPGYTDVTLRQDLTAMVLKSDSLERTIEQNKLYLDNLSTILKGGVPHTELELQDSVTTNNIGTLQVEDPSIKSKDDSLLRDYVEREESYSLSKSGLNKKNKAISDLYFFTPLKGTITNEFDPKNQHYGIDVVAPKNEAIKACLDGTVVFAGWTVETGYVIQIQHKNEMISIYKHNSVLLKEEGNIVKAGDPIAIVGNSGTLTSGPHLHFELWQDGKAMDPTKFITFE